MKGIKVAASAFLLLFILLLGGCGQKEPEGLSIQLDGESAQELKLIYGEEYGGITAVVSPNDYEGELIWSTEDSGIVKVTATEGNRCTVKAKKTGTTKLTVSCRDVTASIKVCVEKDPDNLTMRDSALSVNGKLYSLEVCNLYFGEAYFDFAANYGDYASYYGLDLSAGISNLKEQACDYSEDGTWNGYFVESAVTTITQVQALCDYAEETGISLSEKEQSTIDNEMEKLAEEVSEVGYESIDDYLEANYGPGVSEAVFKQYRLDRALADKAYSSFAESLTYTDDELYARYLELGYEEGDNDFDTTSMRHVLILAEADENGEYSKEAIATAHKKAEELYEQWLAGAADEDSFAELANTSSEDTGSNTKGGLYADIYPGQMVEGIDTWLFDSTRKSGDTAIVDNEGSYVGTHIVYFIGYGDPYWKVLAGNDLRETDVAQWFDSLTAAYETEEGMEYKNIGSF